MPSAALPSGSSKKTLLSRQSNSDSAPICAPGNHHERPANQSIACVSCHAICVDSSASHMTCGPSPIVVSLPHGLAVDLIAPVLLRFVLVSRHVVLVLAVA